MERKVVAVILAGGVGERMGASTPKQFIKIAGKTLFEHTVDVFDSHEYIDDIIIVMHPHSLPYARDLVNKNGYRKVRNILEGGLTRRESSAIGVASIAQDDAKVLIHDAVRPFVSKRIIEDCVRALDRYDAVDVAVVSQDTIVRVNDERLIEDVPVRRYMMRGQTPQAFRAHTIKRAHELAKSESALEVTDDCSLVLKYRLADVFVVPGEETNIKVTYNEDVHLADKIFQLRSQDTPSTVSLDALKGKVIAVFGASRGIGRQICDRAESSGAKVHRFSRRTGVDVRSYPAIEAALRHVKDTDGKLDAVIVTSAVLFRGPLETVALEASNEEIAVNLIGSVNVVKASIGYLKETKGAIALFTSSSYTRGRALNAVYSATKAAIVNLVQGLSEELHSSGVRINAVNPERTATPMRSEQFGNEPPETLLSAEEVAEATLKTVLSGLTGEVIDVRRYDEKDL